MSRKRRNSSSPEFEAPDVKRRASTPSSDESIQYEQTSQTRIRPQVNLETGQTGVFPGLGDEEDELFYGPAADGIDYLRMVRSERKAIPHVLTSQRPETSNETTTNQFIQDTTISDEDNNDGGGFFDDGAYTAKPIAGPLHTLQYPQAQTLYYDSLLVHFNLIRATMKCVPPLSQVEQLTSSQPISFPQESVAARRVWDDQLQNFDPSPVQLACMDSDAALEILRLAKRKIFVLFRTNDLIKVSRLGAWLWSTLGKVPDRGQLSSEEIGDLRQLAKRASAVIKNYVNQNLHDKTGDNSDAMDDEEDDAEHYNTQNQANSVSREPPIQDTAAGPDQSMDDKGSSNPVRDIVSGLPDHHLLCQLQQRKIVILDMLITIIGEMYGQLDLLDLRNPWQPSGSLTE